MYFPFIKKNSIEVFENFSNLDIVTRFPYKKDKNNPNIKNSSAVSKVIVHLAWLKEQNRGFCEADELAFYLVCGKWGKPTKQGGKTNWIGEVVSSSIGLQAELHRKDVIFPFLDKLQVLLFEHSNSILRDSRFHTRWDGSGNVC